jgi:hypothetical protein
MMNSSEALNEFIKLIDNPNATLSELSDLIGKISVDDLVAPENATTHLYTKVGSNKGFINDTIRVLDHTDAFKFLDIFDDEVKTFVVQKLSKNMPDVSDDVIFKLADDFLYGNFDNPNDITKGLWGEISERFALQTKGAVVTHIGDLDGAATRVWWNVEMPAILNGDSVTSVNGIPRTHLRTLYNDLGSNQSALDNICRIVGNAGHDNTNANFLDNIIVGLDADGKITNIDVSGTGSLDDIPNSLTATDFRKAKEIPDDMMRAIYPDFDSKTPLEKIGLKGHTSNYDEITVEFNCILW